MRHLLKTSSSWHAQEMTIVTAMSALPLCAYRDHDMTAVMQRRLHCCHSAVAAPLCEMRSVTFVYACELLFGLRMLSEVHLLYYDDQL